MNDARSDTNRAKIFLSYSRRQVQFAEEIELALSDKGYDVLIDRHSIAKGEEFQNRLGQMILAADTVVFVLSDESATSPVCQWEVSQSKLLGKRILVVSIGELSSGIVPPLDLAKLDWVHCWRNPAVPGSNQTRGFLELDNALRTDLKWLRMQTWLLERASEWEASDLGFEAIHDNSALLLRGTVLEEALDWMAKSPPQTFIANKVTAFLNASEALHQTMQADAAKRIQEQQAAIDEAKRAIAAREMANEAVQIAQGEREAALARVSRRTAIGVSVAGALTFGAAGLAYWARNAESRFVAERKRAESAEATATENSIVSAAINPNISGQITAYAASPGEVALDGEPGGNSPYTAAVLSQLSNRDQSLLGGLMEAHALVRAQSTQRPYLSTNANADIYLRRLPEHWKKRALCVSNPHFPHARNALLNVERDAVAWSEFLEECGFITKRLDAPKLHIFEQAFDWLLDYSPMGGPGTNAERFLRAKSEAELDPTEFLVFVYSGIGFSDGAVDALGASDTEGGFVGDERFEISKPFLLTPRLAQMRQLAGVSVAILDTNFNPATYLLDGSHSR